MKKMNAIMDIRNEKLDAVAGLKVIGKADYKLSVQHRLTKAARQKNSHFLSQTLSHSTLRITQA